MYCNMRDHNCVQSCYATSRKVRDNIEFESEISGETRVKVTVKSCVVSVRHTIERHMDTYNRRICHIVNVKR